ncbi:hypothetical protein NCCP2716_23590 [Sporosarcina sp. NCCP-2716]|uniref:hypothetical protein n=1 Tax=Sporosarcina sp. NCCP-2716 TaxID=2943679 RepID=UPI00203E7C84|nr:hypothetical protein [Sporosarcina sp. NCCP-2716]GKV69861.1 hypothetical protein NCCP2716_23590 [Sporosarcina sp. NCCP-2716]
MPVQYIDINNSQVEFVNGEKDPAKKAEALEAENADLWFQTMSLESKMDEETAAIWFELMKGGMEDVV